MQKFLTLGICMILSSCAIKSNRPDYEYPEASKATGPDWPKLVVTEKLQQAGQTVHDNAKTNQEEADRLSARARALQERAARLQRQIGN